MPIQTYVFLRRLPLWNINLPFFMSTINIEYLVKNETLYLFVLLCHTPTRLDRKLDAPPPPPALKPSM